MIGALMMIGAAVAATPGGFRVGPSAPVSEVALKQVLVMNPGETWLTQSTVAGRAAVGERLLFDFGLPVAYLWEPDTDWWDLGLGQVKLGTHVHFTKKPGRYHQIGLELYVPLMVDGLRVEGWGSLARETLPGGTGLFVWETTWTDPLTGPLTLRLSAGLWGSEHFDFFVPIVPSLELAMAKVFHITEEFSAVAEFEVITDWTPVSARALGRYEEAGFAMDLGVQIPVTEYTTRLETFQLIAQVRQRF